MNDVKRSADYTPTQGAYAPITPFRYFCQKVLPLVYDDSLSYYELLCKVVAHLNTVINNTNGMQTDVTNLYNAYTQLQEYVNHYFDTLDIQGEVDKKLDEMAAGGELAALFAPTVADIAQPKIVTNVSQMVNEKYTYVLESNGHMYQYRNGAWVDTGLVLGGDPDKYFGIRSEVPTDLNNIADPGIYFHATGEGTVTNTPDDIRYNTSSFMVACFKQSDVHNVQLFFPERTGGAEETNTAYYRHQITTGEWSNWSEINTTLNVLPNADLNQIKASGAFYHNGTPAATHTPNDAKYGSSEFMVICHYTPYCSVQVFYDTLHGIVFTRTKGGTGAWLTWDAVMGHRRFLPADDLNAVEMNGYFLHAVVDNPAENTPFNAYGSSTFILESHFFSDSIGYQLFYPTDISTAFMRRRTGTGTWSEWVCINTTGNGLPNNDLNEIKVSGAFFHDTGDTAAVNTPGGYENIPFMLVNYYKDGLTNYQMLHGWALNDVWVRVKKAAGSFSGWKEITGGGEDNIIITKTSDITFDVNVGRATIGFKNEKDSNTNTNTWAIYQILIDGINVCQNAGITLGTVQASGSDITHSLLGGTYGGEELYTFTLFIDGKTINLANYPINEPSICSNVSFVLLSYINKNYNEERILAKRNYIEITKNKITVYTLFSGVADCYLLRANVSALSIKLSSLSKVLTTTAYFTDLIERDTTSINNLNTTFFLNNGAITIKNIVGFTQPLYSGRILGTSGSYTTEFNLTQGGRTISAGQVINGCCEITFV